MPKPYTHPTLYDECKTVSITFLKENGYLQPCHWKSGTITWSRGEGAFKRITGSISIAVYKYDENAYLELDYKSDNKPIKYRIPLISVPSNIGKGVVWYFVCPNTGKRCRKLYLADTYFLHRSAFRDCMYEKQTYSHKNRALFRQWGALFNTDDIYAELYSKHFKKQYNGRPTKRYIKLMKRLNNAGNVDIQPH